MPNWLHRKGRQRLNAAPLRAPQNRPAARPADCARPVLVGAQARPGDRLAYEFAGPSRRTVTVAGPVATLTEDIAADVAATALRLLARRDHAQEVTP